MSNTRSIIRLLAIAAVLGLGSGTLAAGPSLQAQEDAISDSGESTRGHDHYKNGMRWCHCDPYDSNCLGCVTEAPATELTD